MGPRGKVTKKSWFLDNDEETNFNWGFSPNVGAPTVNDAKREVLRKKEERQRRSVNRGKKPMGGVV